MDTWAFAFTSNVAGFWLCFPLVSGELGSSLGLVEIPRSDLACEQLVQFGRSSLRRLRQDKPGTDRGERSNAAGITLKTFRASANRQSHPYS